MMPYPFRRPCFQGKGLSRKGLWRDLLPLYTRSNVVPCPDPEVNRKRPPTLTPTKDITTRPYLTNNSLYKRENGPTGKGPGNSTFGPRTTSSKNRQR